MINSAYPRLTWSALNIQLVICVTLPYWDAVLMSFGGRWSGIVRCLLNWKLNWHQTDLTLVLKDRNIENLALITCQRASAMKNWCWLRKKAACYSHTLRFGKGLALIKSVQMHKPIIPFLLGDIHNFFHLYIDWVSHHHPEIFNYWMLLLHTCRIPNKHHLTKNFTMNPSSNAPTFGMQYNFIAAEHNKRFTFMPYVQGKCILLNVASCKTKE